MRFIRFIRFILRPFFWLLFPYKVVGKENIPKEGEGPPLVICQNHVSLVDPVFLIVCQKRHIYFMAKEELFNNKFLGWLIGKKIGAFPVSRGKGDMSAIEKSEELVSAGKMVGIFIEGTRSKDGKLGRPKSGAALIASQANAHILPAAIVTKNQKNRVFRKTIIIFGKPLSPEELQLDNRERPNLRHASREVMNQIALLMKPYEHISGKVREE